MRLALILGVNGEKVKPRLAKIRDNLNIDCYKNIPLFLDNSIKRDLRYDRVMILTKLIDKTGLVDLYNFWDSYCRDTELIFICKKGDEDNKASAILGKFISTNVACMLLSSTTAQLLADGITKPPTEINKLYGIEDYLHLEEDTDGVEYVLPTEKSESEEVPVVEESSKSKEEPKTEPKKEKKSLFGALFGGKKKKVETSVTEVPVPEVPSQEIPSIVEDSIQVDESSVDEQSYYDDSDTSDGFQYVDGNDINTEDTVSEVDYGSSDTYNEEEVYEDDNSFDYDSEESENEYSSDEQESSGGDFEYEDESDNQYINGTDTDSQEISEEVYKTDNPDSNDDVFGMEDKFENTDINNDYAATEQLSEGGYENSEVSGVDIDFGGMDFTQEPDNKITGNHKIHVEEVDDVDLGDISLAETEHSHREQTTQTKVVTQIVEREVIRHVGANSSVYSNIIHGNAHKTIIFTGDRGTGVTLSAYKLARDFAKKVPVLYVDLDTDRHGLLSYIDYSVYINYNETQLNGLARCQNYNSFDYCVCRYDVNLDILTTSYSCDVSDEQIEIAQSVVAEKEMDYGVVIVDCPIDKLHLLLDLVPSSSVVFCVEASKRGIMNMLCTMTNSPLSDRYKRTAVNHGNIFLTKASDSKSVKNCIKYARTIYEPDGCDYLAMKAHKFDGKYTKEILSEILDK